MTNTIHRPTRSWRHCRLTMAAAFSLGSVGCQTVNDGGPDSELSGTQWTLIDVRTPAGADPEEVALHDYDLQFGKDGSLAVKLMCNRGVAHWSATGGQPGSGIVRISGMAVTQALCHDDGRGERLARDLSASLPYQIYDGRLTLTTDAAVYTFDVVD